MARSATILAALFTAAIISLMANPSPAAEDGAIRIGMTLRMIVENGIKYGQLTSAELNSINDSGGIVGYYFDSTGQHGFLDTAGSFTTINVPGVVFTRAYGINDSGQIVGNFTDASGFTHAFHATPARTGSGRADQARY